MGEFYDIIIYNIDGQMIWFYNFDYVLNVWKWSEFNVLYVDYFYIILM